MAKGSRKKLIPRQSIAWQGKNYNLAVVQKGQNLPIAEKIKIAELICTIYAENKHTLESCLQFCGVLSDSTWYTWKETIKEIEELFIEAEAKKAEKRIYHLRELALTNLERRIQGETIELTETIGEPVTDEKGEILFVKTIAIKKKQIYLKPSDQLISLTLLNTDPINFEKNPSPVERINKDLDIDPIEWVE